MTGLVRPVFSTSHQVGPVFFFFGGVFSLLASIVKYDFFEEIRRGGVLDLTFYVRSFVSFFIKFMVFFDAFYIF